MDIKYISNFIETVNSKLSKESKVKNITRISKFHRKAPKHRIVYKRWRSSKPFYAKVEAQNERLKHKRVA